MGAFLAWVQATGIAATIRESLLLTGALSAVHLVGFTLVTGGAFVANLRLLGVLFPDRPVTDVTGPAGRGLKAGLIVSVVTGLLLFAPRASEASANSTFQAKMSLLAAATAFHFTIHRAVTRRASSSRMMRTAVGGAGFLLWTGLALAGCAYILFLE